MKKIYTIQTVEKEIAPSITNTEVLSVLKLSQFFKTSYELIGAALAPSDLENNVPFACYKDFDFCDANKKRNFFQRIGYMLSAKWKISAGICYQSDIQTVTPPLQKEDGYQGKFLHTLHTGAYRKVEGAYSALFKHAQEHGLKTGTRAYEFYLNDPSKVKASELKTEVYMEIV